MRLIKNQVKRPYYDKVLSLCTSGRLSVILVLAPPRTNSTLVEHVIGNSPSVTHECHEPFFGAGREDVDDDQGYKHIYESIGGSSFESSREQATVVVKDIAQWLMVNDEYKNLVTMSNKPILILIRNPLLAIESRIKKTLSSLSEKIGNSELHDLAQKLNYKTWEHLLEDIENKNRDYTCLEDILKASSKRWTFESDFESLYTQVKYLQSMGIPYHVLDTTDLRAQPEIVTQKMCELLQITYSEDMNHWNTASVQLNTNQNKASSSVWYDTLHKSTDIQQPSEIPPSLSMFPMFVQEHLTSSHLPIYFTLAQEKYLPLDKKLNDTEISIQVTENNMKALIHLGVIDRAAHVGHVSVPLKYVDPVYALTNDPHLLNDSLFQERKKAYSIEMSHFKAQRNTL